MCGRPNDGPTKAVFILTPGTCEYVVGRRDSAEVTKKRILRWGVILNYPGGSNVIIKVLMRGHSNAGPQAKECGWPLEARKGRKQILTPHLSLQEAHTFHLAQ